VLPSQREPTNPSTADASGPAPTHPARTPDPSASPEPTPSYASELDPLLDLAPTTFDHFLVIRDPNQVLDELRRVLDIQRPALLRVIELSGPANPEAVRALKQLDMTRASFVSSGIDFDRGVALFGNEQAGNVLVFASADPEAVNKLVTTIVGKPSMLKCRALTDPAGFVACAQKDDAFLDEYVPAKAAAALRAQLGKSLPGYELEHANVIGRRNRQGGREALAISTASGLIEMHLAPELDPSFEQTMSPAAAPALALAPVGGSFVWAHFDPAFLVAQSSGAPGIVANVAKTWTGEWFFGSLAEPAGMVMMVGLTELGPAAGLVPMFSLVQEQLPKSLPDGTNLSFALESVEGGATSVQTVHAKATGARAEDLAKLGLAPELFAFVAGKYGFLVAGAGADAVKKLAAFDGTGEPAIAGMLPADLAAALRGGRASLAMHFELDALQNPLLREMLASAFASLPASGGPSPKDLLDLGLGFVAPWSSASVWVTDDATGSIVHIALRAFGGDASEEGKAAHAAAAEVEAGTRDARTVYGELAARYPTSARALRYRARSDGSPSTLAPAASGLTIFAGMLAATSAARLVDAPPGATAVEVPAEPAPPKSPR
jgi:hypothetical protein